MFYSQFNQDKFLEETIFKGYKNGFFMDVGAHDGITINNTLYFEKHNGWTGVNIEPIKSVYDKLVKNRPNSININCAVCNNDGTSQFIRNIGYSEMLSGLENMYDKRHVERLESERSIHDVKTEIITVNTKKIETICEEYSINRINYLSIDVEGAEFDVIKSINFNKVYIDVIGFENNYPDTSIPIIKYLEDNNYNLMQRGHDIIMLHKSSQFN
jgi:FkbM family methyltransferase